MKTLKDCMQYAYESTLCFFATTEKDQPHVRALSFWFADKTGLYFQTVNSKEFIHQLKENSKVEICFYKHEIPIGTTLRIIGKAEFVDDLRIKEKAIQDRPFLKKEVGLTATSPELCIFKIVPSEAYFWRLEDNLKPKEIIKF